MIKGIFQIFDNLFDSIHVKIHSFVFSTLTFIMTLPKSDPLNANGVPLTAAEAQVLKNGLPSALLDIDV
jgi:hypothetical protein